MSSSSGLPHLQKSFNDGPARTVKPDGLLSRYSQPSGRTNPLPDSPPREPAPPPHVRPNQEVRGVPPQSVSFILAQVTALASITSVCLMTGFSYVFFMRS